uniref:Uncharacterized protein n=1 Tax=Clastoptera arizonana TaxID=38151 RepID=A0A1B6DA94_9HEMI
MFSLKSKYNFLTSTVYNQYSGLVLKKCVKKNILMNSSYYSTNDDKDLAYSEKVGAWQSAFHPFLNKRSSPPDISRFNPKLWSMHRFQTWLNIKKREKLCFEQRYLDERHRTLGNDLAAAHFLIYRGGAVKFVGHTKWIKDTSKNKDYDDELPRNFDPLFYVEALDLSKCEIVYEGLENIKDCIKLNWLSFNECPHFDDWCLDRISAMYKDNLEYLDISNTKVTDRGLCALYKCRKLKFLKVHGISDSKLFQLACLLLEDLHENLQIDGVKYMDLNECNQT